MKFVGPTQYGRVLEAVEYYRKLNYTFVDVPWTVSAEALCITKPPSIPLYGCPSYTSGGENQQIVASAEQSFLEQQLEYQRKWSGAHDYGKYVALTPCFRNEPVIDNLHQPYFLKSELINWKNLTERSLHSMIADAYGFFTQFLTVDVVENREPGAGELAFDIVSRRGRIELGSYGIRQHEKVGKWVYGTGCAEPRLSYALDTEGKL